MMHLPGRLFLGNLVQRRALLAQMVRRDFEQRYVGSAAGWLWGLIHPLVLLLSWTFVFQVCMKIELPRGAITQNYTLFLLAGYLPWFLFQETVLRSATSLVDQSNLITKTVFPAEIIPISIFLSSVISHLFTLSLVIIAVAAWLGHFSVNLLLLPFYMLCTGLFAIGIGWIAASLQVYLRDTAQFFIVLLTLWFWLTPIFITEDQYPDNVQFLLHYNPMAFLVQAYRERLLSNIPPDPHDLLVLALYSASAFMVGGLVFRQLKRGFADVL
ncbi:MAG: ABC transporter permease [Acidobacteriia bacterium]|nr:ABC transporter permease [Terriglobia bacterium]